MEQPTCPECDGPVTRRGKRGPRAVYCSPLCKSRAAERRAIDDGRHRAQLDAANARAAAERAANQKPCPYCGELMDGWRMQCGASDCKRRITNERAVAFKRAYKERTGQHYRYKYEHEHVCEACGKTWTSRDPGTRFCSGACANSVRSWERTCEACGASWAAGRADARFCSPDCRAAASQAARSRLVLYTGTAPRPRRARPSPLAVLPPLRKRWYAGFCVDCGEAFVHDQPQTITCSPRCYARLSRAQRRAVKKSAFVENVSRRKIYERDGWRCQLCRKPVKRDAVVPHPKAPVLDHIIPLAVGGTHEPANVQCAHFLCNSLKGDRGSGEQLLLIG